MIKHIFSEVSLVQIKGLTDEVLHDKPHKRKENTRLLFAKEMARTTSHIYHTEQDQMQIQWRPLRG